MAEESATKTFAQYKSVVRRNPLDFDAWVWLAEQAESNEPIEVAREVFIGFLSEYPLCFGYWKKLVKLELSRGNSDHVDEIFQRSCMAAPHSVDMWFSYLDYASTHWQDDPKKIRELFEQAISVVGTDYRSDTIWDLYLRFESSCTNYRAMSRIYARIFKIPLRNSEKYVENFRSFAVAPLTAAIVAKSQEEMDDVKGSLMLRMPEGSGEPHEVQLLAAIVEHRLQEYAQTQETLKKIDAFESSILRPYFHIKALEADELANWRAYLTFAESFNDTTFTIKLYERCLIPCSLYFEFWSRYVAYLERMGLTKDARQVLRRAAYGTLKRRPEASLALAAFEEAHNHNTTATNLYNALVKGFPRHIESNIRAANYFQRQNNYERVDEIFQKALSHTEKANSALPLQYARFLHKTMKDLQRAREVLQAATELHPLSVDLWLSRVEFEVSVDTPFAEIQAILDVAVQTEGMPQADLVRLLERNLVLIDDLGGSIIDFRKTEKAIFVIRSSSS